MSVLAVGAAADARPQVARTDVEGRWLLAVQEGPGSYVVRATALGMTPASDTARRGAEGKAIIVDFKLQQVAQLLDQVNVVDANRPRPPREIRANDQAQSENGIFQFTSGLISVADAGNLGAMAGTVPGATPLAGGYSVLGLSGDQNRTTLNGMSFGGGEIPRDAFVAARVATTSYDVSRGGFSGGQVSILLNPGNNFHQRLLHLSLDAPSLQVTDAVGRRLGQPYTNVQVSGSAIGPLVYDHLFYNVSAQAGRRSSDLQTLLTDDAFSLQRVGVAQDSVSRLVTTFGLRGLPLTSSAVPSGRLTDNASLLARIDMLRTDTTTGNIVVSLRRSTSMASFLGATAVPGHGGEVTTTGADVTAVLSKYLWGKFLNDLRLGARTNNVVSDAYLELPDVRVLVTSSFSDSTTSTASLLFGGNPGLPRSAQAYGFELFDQFSWFSIDRKHRVRATVNLRDDGFSQDQYPNRRGTYVFNSIADVEANQPTSFSRVFVGQNAEARAYTASASLGDDWRPNGRTQYQFGARVDANRFANHAPFNPQVDAAFGVRTDYAPRTVDVSPRLGFFRAFGTNGTTGIPGFGAPWGTVRGGFGLFRNDVAPTILAQGLLASGLSNGVQQIRCVGAAVPLPDWQAYAGNPSLIPSQCADTTSSSPFNTSQPNVWLIDSRFKAQRSWRGNLALQGYLIPKLINFSVEGIYSTNRHQQAPRDLNFSAQQRFTLTAEGGRPVYALPGSIVQATGALTNRDSRLDPAFGSVTSLMTDLRSEGRQVVVSVYPFGGAQLGRFTQWFVNYVHQTTKEQGRGFGGTTGGNPLDVEWARSSADFRHQVNATFYTRLGKLFSVQTTARFQSGTPYTPLVSGDINGDGLSNDRAFVFDPATADPAVAAGMSALLAGAPSKVQRCLRSQLGRIASANSCEGPWTATMNARLVLNPERLRWDNRLQLSLSLTNVPAGLDALLHGSGGLQGWGQPVIGDPSLLAVRGFDAATNRFAYEVNPRFGDTRISRTGIRAPFLVTLETRVQLGRDFTRQTLSQVVEQGRSRRGDKLTLQQVKNRLIGSVFNPIRGLFQAKDSLSILTNEQFQKLSQLDRAVSAKWDSLVTPLAQEIVALPTIYDEDAIVKRVLALQNVLFDTVVEGMRQAGKIFTQEQIDQFPPALASSFDIERLLTTRPVAGFFPNY